MTILTRARLTRDPESEAQSVARRGRPPGPGTAGDPAVTVGLWAAFKFNLKAALAAEPGFRRRLPPPDFQVTVD